MEENNETFDGPSLGESCRKRGEQKKKGKEEKTEEEKDKEEKIEEKKESSGTGNTTMATMEKERLNPNNHNDDDDDDNNNNNENDNNGEEEQPRGVAGYAHLAEFMTKTQYGMVRRYREISMQNLLYLQAEIHQIKTELDEEVAVDATFPEYEERSNWDYHWWILATSGNRGEGKRWKIWLKLRAKMYEYYDAIEKHYKVASLISPSEERRSLVSEYIYSDEMNMGRCNLLSAEMRGDEEGGIEPEVYRAEHLEDLVYFGSPGEDSLEKYCVDPFLNFIHQFIYHRKRTVQEDLESGGYGIGEDGKTKKKNRKNKIPKKPAPDFELYQYNTAQYTALNKVVGAVVSVILPCAAVISLNYVQDQNKRVAMVCVFALVFCVGMSLLTRAKRIEVFAATAAFMSVQLVFVGGNGDN